MSQSTCYASVSSEIVFVIGVLPVDGARSKGQISRTKLRN